MRTPETIGERELPIEFVGRSSRATAVAACSGAVGVGEKSIRTRPLRERDSPVSISSHHTAARPAARTNGSPNFVEEATKSAPPFAGSADRLAILAPVLERTSRVDVIKTEG